MENKAEQFFIKEILKIENRLFMGSIFISIIEYVIVTAWLNNIRAMAAIWFVWVLILIQFLSYFYIFIYSYRRAQVFGLNRYLSLTIFVILAILGRVNNWELIVIPTTVIIMTILSSTNKKISEKRKSLLSK